jgi:hypothetical protein
MGEADALKTEGLMLESMHMGHIGAGCQAELPIISICTMWMERSKMMCIIRPRSHKASKANGLRGNTWKDVKWVSRDNFRELGYHSGGRWRHIPSLRSRISVRRGRKKSRGMLRT